MIAFKATEGALGLSLGRTAKLLCTVQQADGSWKRHSFSSKPADFGIATKGVEKVESPSLARNAALVRSFLTSGGTDDAIFDARVRYTLASYGQALDWIEANRPA